MRGRPRTLAEALERARTAAAAAALRDRELAALDAADLSRGDRTRAHANARRERDRAELDEIDARAEWHALTSPALGAAIARHREEAARCASRIDAIHDVLVEIAAALDRDDTPARITLGGLLEQRERDLEAAHDACRRTLASLAAASGRRFGEG